MTGPELRDTPDPNAVPAGMVRIKCGWEECGYRDVPEEHFKPSEHARYDERDRVAPEGAASDGPAEREELGTSERDPFGDDE